MEDYRKKCSDFIIELLGLDRMKLIDTLFYAKLENLHKYWSYETIYETMKQSEETLIEALDEKTFYSYKNEISYIMAVIQNRVLEIDRGLKNEEYSKTHTTITEEDDESMQKFTSMKNIKHKVKNISKWL